MKGAGAMAGAAVLCPDRLDAVGFPLWQQPIDPPRGGDFPSLNARARGWLRFLWEKTTTPDDWSRRGKPHLWWDVYSAPGVQSYGRFDFCSGISVMRCCLGDVLFWIRASGLRRERVSAWGWGPTRVRKDGERR